MKITLYVKPNCVPCGEALEALRHLAARYDIRAGEINVVDIIGQPGLGTEFGGTVPVIEIEDGTYGRLSSPFDPAQLRIKLDLAWRELQHGGGVAEKTKEGSPLDRVARYIGQRWLRFTLIALGIFVGLPWLAPIFAALGWWGLADPIYTAYAVT